MLQPSRTAGNTRRYSQSDIDRLQSIQRLTQEHGINLAGVKMIVEMEAEMERLRRKMESMAGELERIRRSMSDRAIRVERTAMVPLSAVRKFSWQGRR